jgi:hypothetical protein
MIVECLFSIWETPPATVSDCPPPPEGESSAGASARVAVSAFPTRCLTGEPAAPPGLGTAPPGLPGGLMRVKTSTRSGSSRSSRPGLAIAAPSARGG